MMQEILATAFAASLLAGSVGGTVGEMPQMSDYTYSYYADVVAAPASYEFKRSLTGEQLGLAHFNSLEDMDTDDNGNLFILDASSNLLVRLNADLELTATVSTFLWEGQEQTFSGPKGVSCGSDGRVYVADTKNGRIVVFNEALECVDIIGAPAMEDAQYDYEYLPSKVEADSEGRMYVVSENQTQGIFQFDRAGNFMGYFGATKVETNISELFFRLFASREQLQGMLQFIPTEYSNITLDESNFIYGTVAAVDSWDILSDIQSRKATVNPVRRLNQKGVDILVLQGAFPPVGELSFTASNAGYEGASTFVDVAVYQNGIYSILDSKRGRVFTYDDQGNLMYLFGGRGEENGMFLNPTAILYIGDHIAVADKGTGTIQFFQPTEYARQLMRGIALYQEGEYDAEKEVWESVLEVYPGCVLANSGLGRSFYNEGNYSEAMAYFRLANDRTNYSDALKGAIRVYGQAVTPWILGGALALLTVILVHRGVRRKHPKPAVVHRETRLRCIWKQIKYAGYISLHPFDGFWDLKHEKRGSVLSATILLFLAVVANVLHVRLMPFLFNAENFKETSALFSGATGVLAIIALFVVANWALTTLMDGKGSFREIYIFTCYSFFPMIVLYPPIVVVSYFLYAGSAAFLSMLSTLTMIWIVLLIFCGTCVTHEYSAGKTIVTLLLTVIGMLIILFLCILTLTLIQQMVTFVQMVAQEIRLSL